MAGTDQLPNTSAASTDLEDDRAALLRQLTASEDPPAEPVTKPGISLKAVVIVLVALGTILLVIWAPWDAPSPPTPLAPAGQESPEVDEAAPQHATTSSAQSQPPQEEPTEEENGEVVVHVVGRVKEPGLITLEEGARVADAIKAAGGPTKSADLTRINLARVLHDEEHLVILNPDEDPPELPATESEGNTTSNGNNDDQGGADVLNLNTANQNDLETLPGVGPVMAERIIQWRDDNGKFSAVEDLHEISGIGPKVFAQLQPLVTV